MEDKSKCLYCTLKQSKLRELRKADREQVERLKRELVNLTQGSFAW